MSKFDDELNAFFNKFQHAVQEHVPNVIAETATEYYKERFLEKEWNGQPWAKYKGKEPSRGSLMLRSNNLMQSIRPKLVSAQRVIISAGSSKVPYAQVHNEGGIITRSARSETFVRNRIATGKKKGRFKRGTSEGQGFTFKASTYNMPQRQFMGHNQELNDRIKTRFNNLFKSFLKP
ncbi:phage virion morphogenesis protein [Solitalea koreensis]|uniref:Phage virion morphogenesis family protein n=1 Tax=Solitalea koreensis TaxID=543615 RepID=A0A521BM52_9SPHI|nr:phage virion morphogenesis protein [Solitalea koreensis]SMO48203.1 Phage virion morphogenesis family protein [Solitalea koreensis]